MSILYHELRETETSKARELMRKVLAKNNGNVDSPYLRDIKKHLIFMW